MPLIKKIEENPPRFEITWNSENKQDTILAEKIFLEYGGNTTQIPQPSYYFTHGRMSSCSPSAMVNLVILKLFNKDSMWVGGKIPHQTSSEIVGHAWVETVLDGKPFVVNYNNIFVRDTYYEIHGWTVTSPDYDPDWYKK